MTNVIAEPDYAGVARELRAELARRVVGGVDRAVSRQRPLEAAGAPG